MPMLPLHLPGRSHIWLILIRILSTKTERVTKFIEIVLEMSFYLNGNYLLTLKELFSHFVK